MPTPLTPEGNYPDEQLPRDILEGLVDQAAARVAPDPEEQIRAIGDALVQAASHLSDPKTMETILADEKKLREARRQRKNFGNKIRQGYANSDDVITWFHLLDPLHDDRDQDYITAAINPRERKNQIAIDFQTYNAGTLTLLRDIASHLPVGEWTKKDGTLFDKFKVTPGIDTPNQHEIVDLVETILYRAEELPKDPRITVLLVYAGQLLKINELMATQLMMQRTGTMSILTQIEHLENGTNYSVRAVMSLLSSFINAVTIDHADEIIDEHPEVLDLLIDALKFKLAGDMMHATSVERAQQQKEPVQEQLVTMLGVSEADVSDEDLNWMIEDYIRSLYFMNGTTFRTGLLDEPLPIAKRKHTAEAIDSVLSLLRDVYDPGIVSEYERRTGNTASGFLFELLWQVDLTMAQLIDSDYCCFVLPAFQSNDKPWLNNPKLKRAFDITIVGLHGAKTKPFQLKSSEKAGKKAKKAYHSSIGIIAEKEFAEADIDTLLAKIDLYQTYFREPTPENERLVRASLLPSVTTFLAENSESLRQLNPQIGLDIDSMSIAKGIMKTFSAGFKHGQSGKKSKRTSPIPPTHRGRVTISPKYRTEEIIRQRFENK